MDDVNQDRDGSTDSAMDIHLNAGRSLLNFIDRSPTPFHVVDELRRWLKKKSFMELDEADAWELRSGGKYFVIRNDSSLVAFVVGEQVPEVAGMKIIGAHTDSPNLKIKPNPAYEKNGYVQLGVEVYGGVLLSTWTDRDLSLAGRVVLEGKGSRLESRLLMINRPILRIPQLAIHLNRKVNDKGLILNKQTHMAPTMALADAEMNCETRLRDMVAEELRCPPEEIAGMELSLFDLQKGVLGGPENEFLFSARLDDLASCHAATTALLESETK
ncbi:MAG: M18 family aminopeptidase, partial [Nitrospinales bacterium]